MPPSGGGAPQGGQTYASCRKSSSRRDDAASLPVQFRLHAPNSSLLIYPRFLASKAGVMCSSAEVIVLSDEDEPVEGEASVLIVEEERNSKNDSVLSSSALEEDLVVTFSRRADLLPHARYDCPIQPFMATECEISAPMHNNQLMCEQCFCYICDKLASQCEVWSTSGMCHCNSHKKSTFWNNQRNSCLLGGLQTFNLTLCDIDSHLRHAEMLLQRFKAELSVRFSAYLSGNQAYTPTTQGRVHDYTPVYEWICSFLDLAEKQDNRAGAIMQLGAAEAFVRHYPVSGTFALQTTASNPALARTNYSAVMCAKSGCTAVGKRSQCILVHADVTGNLLVTKTNSDERVLHRIPPQTTGLLQEAVSARSAEGSEEQPVCAALERRPPGFRAQGQNVCGSRKDRGKKDVLLEQISVVQLRTEQLQHQGRYRELCRYLRVVQTDDPKIFNEVLDLMPFFLCVDGQLGSALQSLLTSQSSRLSPRLFLSYLHIFRTATAPVQILRRHSDLCSPNAAWKTIKDAVPLKSLDLVKFALKAQAYCSDILNDAQCWVSVLSLVTSPSGFGVSLPEPSAQYLHESKDLLRSLLALSKKSCYFHIPRHFQEVYPEQALLLLLTEALCERILVGPFHPVLPVLYCFQNNTWALRWLWDRLAFAERVGSFMSEMTQEMHQSPGESGESRAEPEQNTVCH
ncbi:hypothetical protein WMY93_005676 [Mugilogobius chulae]|uniref:Uncharacterized protein n=1 Tax=Mugilogobius chulae TaxID=88201 RepID=A0AAW0PM23_9GOBI